ncbi:MAG: response regulator [Pseudomonadota bacterium]
MSDPCSILIVEDEPLIAMMLEDFVEGLGYQVSATCESVGDALAKVAQGGFDLAILDVHLQGETIWPVAEALRERNVPFVLATGGHVDPPPAEFESVAVLEKPYTIERVESAIGATLARA